MMKRMVDIQKHKDFYRLVAALGAAGNTNLHIIDEDHNDDSDYALLMTPQMREAMLAGNYANLAVERGSSAQERAALQGIKVIAPDSRVEHIIEKIRESGKSWSAAAANEFEQDPQFFLNIWYSFSS